MAAIPAARWIGQLSVPSALVSDFLTLMNRHVRLQAREKRVFASFDEQGLIAGRSGQSGCVQQEGGCQEANSASVLDLNAGKGDEVLDHGFPRCLKIGHQKAAEPIKRFVKVRGEYEIAIELGAHRRLQIHNESKAPNGEDSWVN
jgi:hypothetical protein